MKASPGSIVLALALAGGFGVEIATYSVGNDASLLKLGALPDNGKLNGQYWRFVTYSFLHFNWAHLLVNILLLLWVRANPGETSRYIVDWSDLRFQRAVVGNRDSPRS
jgi:membrane associated rhomboid family serine protease